MTEQRALETAVLGGGCFWCCVADLKFKSLI
jgi:peptide methionine sulfoxide reductase MsrA